MGRHMFVARKIQYCTDAKSTGNAQSLKLSDKEGVFILLIFII